MEQFYQFWDSIYCNHVNLLLPNEVTIFEREKFVLTEILEMRNTSGYFEI